MNQRKRCAWPHAVLDCRGRQVCLSPAAWAKFVGDELTEPNAAIAISRLARSAGTGPLFVLNPSTGEPAEILRYVRVARMSDISFDGPAPLTMSIAYDPPALSGFERSTEADQCRHIVRVLMDLPRQHAVLKVVGRRPEVIRLADVDDIDFGPESEAFIEAVQRANGQSPEAVKALIAERRARRGYAGIDTDATGGDDGSI